MFMPSPPTLANFFPFLKWGQRLTRENVIADATAGMTNAAVVLPQAIAFAGIAGLPAQYGLYSAIVIPIIAALFGSSWHLVSGPTTAISILIFATLSPLYPPGSAAFVSAAITMTFLVGLIQLVLGWARLGQLMNFVSHSVLIGFTSGAGVLIALSQIKVLMPRPSQDPTAGHDVLLVEQWQALMHANPYALGLAAIALGTAAGVKFFAPRWPNYLIGMVVGSLVAYGLDAQAHGVAFVRPIASALPQFAPPTLDIASVQILSQGAFAVALVALLEAVSIARGLATQSGQQIDTRQEIIGQGLSNLIGSLFSCYAGSGSFTRSGLNLEAGAKSPLSAILASVFLVLIVWAMRPLIAFLPIPVIAGLIILIAWRLIDFKNIRQILIASKSESAILIFTLISVLIIDLELAIFGGVILSLCLFIRKTTQTDVPIWAPSQSNRHRSFVSGRNQPVAECPQAVFARLQGPLYFGSLEALQAKFLQIETTRPDQKHLVLGIDGNIGMDLSGAEFLMEEARKRRARGGGLYLVVKYPRLRHQVAQFGLARALGPNQVFRRKSEAIPRLIRKLDPDICATCKNRIFLECPKAMLPLKGGSQSGSQVGVVAE